MRISLICNDLRMVLQKKLARELLLRHDCHDFVAERRLCGFAIFLPLQKGFDWLCCAR
jgi:hypothetical protein